MKREKITHKEQLKDCCIKIGNNKQLSYLVQTKLRLFGLKWRDGEHEYLDYVDGYILTTNSIISSWSKSLDKSLIKPSQLGIKKWMYKEKAALKYIVESIGNYHLITKITFNKDYASFNISSIPHLLILSFKDGSISFDILDQIATLTETYSERKNRLCPLLLKLNCRI